MKKGIFVLIVIVLVLLCGELFSNPRTIVRQENNMNVWRISHMFNLYSTETYGPINDTARVVIKDKNIVNGKYMVHVSNGSNITILRSKTIFQSVEVGDMVDLTTIFEPVSNGKYTIKYIVNNIN